MMKKSEIMILIGISFLLGIFIGALMFKLTNLKLYDEINEQKLIIKYLERKCEVNE